MAVPRSLARPLPAAVAGADTVAFHIGQAAENGNHQPPGADIGPRFRQGSELRLGVYDAVDELRTMLGAKGYLTSASSKRCRVN
jgi:hypothetical protein